MHYEEMSNLLVEAADLVTEDRKAQYGDFKKNHEDIAAMWSVVLGTKIHAYQVALCMVSVKICRSTNPTIYTRDNYVDAAAYMAMAGTLQQDKTGDLT